MTELHFCNVCQQSVPQIKLDTGDAVRHGKRVICPDCADTLVIATELEPKKREWKIQPVVVALFMTTWAAFAFVYVEQQNFIISEGKARTQIRIDNNRLSQSLTKYKTELMSEIGAVKAIADQDLILVVSRFEQTENALRDALNRQAQDLAEFDALPQSMISLTNNLNLATAELQALSDSNREIRQGQLVLRDKLAEIERKIESAPAPVDVDSNSFSSSVQSILEDLQASDPNIRFTALEEIADQNDPNLVPYILPLLADSYEFCRYQAATTLRSWGALSAVPELIEALDDDFEFVRKEVNAALEGITKISVGYNHKDDQAKRDASQQAWRDWWQNGG